MPLPEPLPESGNAQRYFHKSSKHWIAKVLPGFFYVTRHQEQVMTVLGSCIAACVRDPVAGVGGMNHFMLPSGTEERANTWGSGSSAANRYGNFAMENLLNSLIKHGARKDRLEVKIFGGGSVLNISSNVGARNIEFAKQYLATENLMVIASDVGSDCARKVIYDPLTGKTRVKRLREVYTGLVVSQEKELAQSLNQAPVDGSVELFE